MVRWLSKMRRRHIYKHIDPTQVNDSLKGKYTSPMDLSWERKKKQTWVMFFVVKMIGI